MADFERCGEPVESGSCRRKADHEGPCKWWSSGVRNDGCNVEGCDRDHYGRGFCSMHWNRWKRYGSPHVVHDRGGDTEAMTRAIIEKGKRTAQERLRRYRNGETVEQMAEAEGITPKSMLHYLRERCGVDFHEVGAPLAADTVLDAIIDQVCPWCGRGPFKHLALHTVRVHEISAEDLCEMADIPKTWATCDPELVELHREIQRGLGQDMERVRSFQQVPGGMQQLSDAGRRVIREKLQDTKDRIGASEMARRAAQNQPAGHFRRAGEHLGEVRAEQVRKIPREDYKKIMARLDAGETTTQIAAEYGVHRDHIGAIRRGDRPRRRRG